MEKTMKLKKFRVTNFRSVDDSGWIETDDVTALIGTNEAGKTNILLPLWKLNPAKEGEIVPTADYPRKRFTTFRGEKQKPVFVTAIFEADEKLAQELSTKTGLPKESFDEIVVSRRFSTEYEVDFPHAAPARSIPIKRVATILDSGSQDIGSMTLIEIGRAHV
jgi:predicted ATP-dependent endonuclease of OLD family